MIEEKDCLRDFHYKKTVFGEYQSKLVGIPDLDKENAKPTVLEKDIAYDLQIERKLFSDLKISPERFNIGDSVLKRPISVPLQNVMDMVTGVVDKVVEGINGVLGTVLLNDANSNPVNSDVDETSVIKYIKWHPQFKILAVVNKNDIVYVFNFQSVFEKSNILYQSESLIQPVPLWFELQTNIKDIQWKPNYPLTLALATENGIVVWEMDIESTSRQSKSPTYQQQQYRPTTSSIVLNYPYFRPTTISWSKDGLQLVAGSSEFSSIIVWDVASRVPTLVSRYGGNSVLSFNSNSQLLLSCSYRKQHFRIYNTSNWQFEGKEWPQIANYQTGCWSPNGDYLCVASSDKLTFIQSENNAMDTNGVLKYLERTTSYECKSPLKGKTQRIRGHVKSVVWSPDGQRLAVLFFPNKESELNKKVVAIYRVKTYPKFELSPRGYIKKAKSGAISGISFLPNYQKGSLLSVAYANGTISFFPLLYKNKQYEVS